MRKIRVLVVDDSAVVRRILTDVLSAESDIEVVGSAPDPVVARTRLEALRPDVLTLDIEMPRMDGLSFLRQLMSDHPLPVVIISSLAQAGGATALEAMATGAVEVLAKPSGPYSVGDLRFALAQKVRAAAQARLFQTAASTPHRSTPVKRNVTTPVVRPHWPIIAIGASTGGTEAIARVLQRIPENCPPILVVQHIPPVFSRAFADRLDRLCPMRVKEAADGDVLCAGHALIAPGDFHMLLRRSGSGLAVQVKNGPRVCYQRPSVDVLFQSVADATGSNSIGVILTGMGNDGAAGLLKLRSIGARTIGQDERTSTVYGMPKEAAKAGAVEQQLPLEKIGDAICAIVRSRSGPPVN